MAEYIERAALLAEYDRVHVGPPGGARKLIEEAPAGNVVPVVHGRWLDTGYYGHSKSPIYMCSNCRKEVEDYYIKNHKFCLHCGARMDGE